MKLKLIKDISRILYYAINNPNNLQITQGTLRRYSYNEPYDVLMNAMFQVLVDYVEIDCALSNWDNRKKKYLLAKIPIINAFVPPKRSVNYGTDYLLQQSEAIENDPHHIKDEVYCNNWAQTLLFLYLWWTKIRPARICSWEESGLKEWIEAHPDFDMIQTLRMSKDQKENDMVYQKFIDLSKKRADIDNKRDEEDNRMMHILLNNKQHMWT